MLKDRLKVSVARVMLCIHFRLFQLIMDRTQFLYLPWTKHILNLLLKLMRFAEATPFWEYCLASISV